MSRRGSRCREADRGLAGLNRQEKAKEISDLVTVILGILTILVGSYLPLVAVFAAGFYSLFWISEVTILALYAPCGHLPLRRIHLPAWEGGTFPGHGHRASSRALSWDVCGVAGGLLPLLGHADCFDLRSPWGQQIESHPGVLWSYLVYTMVLWRTIHFSFEILYTRPYWAMKVLGIESRDGQKRSARVAGGPERPTLQADRFFRFRPTHSSKGWRKKR